MVLDKSQEKMLDVAEKYRGLIDAIYDHPEMNSRQPDQSPKILWHTSDFIRRTWTDYIAPNLPADKASLPPGVAFADPRCEDPRRGMPGAPPISRDVLPTAAARAIWPRFSKYKYTDTISRSFMAEQMIINPTTGAAGKIYGSDHTFEFGDDVRAALTEVMDTISAWNKKDQEAEEERTRERQEAKAKEKAAAAEGEGEGERGSKKTRNQKKKEKMRAKAKEKKGKGSIVVAGEGPAGEGPTAEGAAGEGAAGGDGNAEVVEEEKDGDADDWSTDE